MILAGSLFNVLNVVEGGLVVFGSILGAILGALVFMRLNKMPVLRTFDIMVPAAMLGIAIGRIGCLLNGCCFGGITDAAWGIVFPADSPAHQHQIAKGDVFYYGLKFEEKTIGEQKILIIKEVQPKSEAEKQGLKRGMPLGCLPPPTAKTNEKIRFDFFTHPSQRESQPFFLAPTPAEVLPVHPTQIYSSCLALLLCGVLLLLGRLRFYQQRAGLVFASFMILYSAGRFMIEFVRTDEDSFFGTGLTVSQNVSIVFGLVGVALFVYLWRRKG
jgi:phosphatidylglycerol:prolipoprotein diacylglycerol transferase